MLFLQRKGKRKKEKKCEIIFLNNKKIKIEKNGKYLEKEYRILRIDRKGRISIIGKGDRDEIKFSTLRYKIIKN